MTHAELESAAKRQADFIRGEWGDRAKWTPHIAELVSVLDHVPLLICGLRQLGDVAARLTDRLEDFLAAGVNNPRAPAVCDTNHEGEA